MASIIEELITALEGELVLYEKLIPIAEKKSVAIIENDLEALSKVTEKEQLILDDLTVLENKRVKSVKNIKDVLNIRDELNLDRIIQILEKQPVEQQKLKTVHEELKFVTERLKQLNLQNRDLIVESLKMIEFSMNFIQSTRMSQGSNNYTRSASITEGSVPHTGMFDAKQ